MLDKNLLAKKDILSVLVNRGILKMKKKNIIAAVIIVVILGVGLFGKAVFDEVKLRIKVNEVLTQVFEEKIKNENIDYNSMGKYGDSVKDVVSNAEKLITDVNNLEDDAKKYEVEKVMNAKYLKDPVSGKQNLQDISKSILGFEQLFNNDMEQLSDSLEKMPLSNKDKEDLRKTIENENKNLSKEIQPTVEYLKVMFTKNEALFDFLIQKRGKYSVQGDQILFNSEKDMNDFNKLVDDLNKFVNSN